MGENAIPIGECDHKLWYTSRDRNRNGVGIVLDCPLVDGLVNVRKKGDRFAH